MKGSWSWVMGIGWLLFLAFIGFLVYLLVSHHTDTATLGRQGSTAEKLLTGRLARRKNDEDEYGRRPTPSAPRPLAVRVSVTGGEQRKGCANHPRTGRCGDQRGHSAAFLATPRSATHLAPTSPSGCPPEGRCPSVRKRSGA
jgi:hypothetical protein